MSVDLNDEDFASSALAEEDAATTTVAANAAADVVVDQELVDRLMETSLTGANSGAMDDHPEESSTTGAEARRNQLEASVLGEGGRG